MNFLHGSSWYKAQWELVSKHGIPRPWSIYLPKIRMMESTLYEEALSWWRIHLLGNNSGLTQWTHCLRCPKFGYRTFRHIFPLQSKKQINTVLTSHFDTYTFWGRVSSGISIAHFVDFSRSLTEKPNFHLQWWVCSAICHCLRFVFIDQHKLPFWAAVGHQWSSWVSHLLKLSS
jgi:hypothetical protein